MGHTDLNRKSWYIRANVAQVPYTEALTQLNGTVQTRHREVCTVQFQMYLKSGWGVIYLCNNHKMVRWWAIPLKQYIRSPSIQIYISLNTNISRHFQVRHVSGTPSSGQQETPGDK